MSLEGFVRQSGALMGVARDSFGSQVPGAPSPVLASVPAGPGGAQGLAAEGFAGESGVLDGQVSVLGSYDASSQRQLDAAAAASQAGRGRVDGVIDGAAADVDALAPATNTPAGQRALVDALTRRLHDTKQALSDGHNDAFTRAADAETTAAGYTGVGRFPQSQPAVMPAMPTSMPMPQLPQMPMLPDGGDDAAVEFESTGGHVRSAPAFAAAGGGPGGVRRPGRCAGVGCVGDQRRRRAF